MKHSQLFLIALFLSVTMVHCGGKADSQKAQGNGSCDESKSTALLEPSNVEFFDAHGHLMPTWPPETLIKAAQTAGVSGMVLLGVGDVRSYQDKKPELFLACTWFDPADEDFDSIVADLDKGTKCLGETSIRHFPSGPKNQATEHNPNTPFMMKVYQEATQRQIPVNIHFDYTDEHIGDFQEALNNASTTTFIWAHMGDANAAQVRTMLSAHANLMVDISSRNPLCSFEGRFLSMDEQRLDNGDWTIKDEWRSLFEDYSDRVMFGTDIGPGSRHTDISLIVTYYRILLGQLTTEAQERIAFKNAKSIFGVN